MAVFVVDGIGSTKCWSRGPDGVLAPGEEKYEQQARIDAVAMFGPQGYLRGKQRTDFSSVERILREWNSHNE